MNKCGVLIAPIAMLMTGIAADAQVLSGRALVNALRQGGYVIVMRHASSPREAPDRQTANSDNVNLERQLDAAGRAGAIGMGYALRALKIPIGDVLTSPTYRALETVRFAQVPNAQPFDELGDGGQSMQGIPERYGAWLRDKVAQAPPKGRNTLIVTHMPNLARAFPTWGSGVTDGESVILRPGGQGGAQIVGRITIDEWPRLR